MADRKVSVRLDANVSGYVRGMAQAKAATALLRQELNDSNDHTAWLAGSLLALAPAAVPIGATVVPTVMALTTQLGLAAVAGGTMALAFVGIGDGLSALNAYQLDPTKENLKELNEVMNKLGPDGAEFVKFLDSIGPQFNELRLAARGGMFPGIEQGITEFMDRLPDLKEVVTGISTTIGQLATDAGTNLGGPEFDNFFEYLKDEAPGILLDTGRALGNFIDGWLEMSVAFGPLTDDITGGLLDMSERFEAWAEGLSESESFQAFVDYIREVTPEVKAFIGQLSDTFVELAQGLAPVGEPMLRTLTVLLDVLGAIASTPVGSILLATTAVASLIGRLIALKNLAGGSVIGAALTGQLTTTGRALGKAGADAEKAAKRMQMLHGATAGVGIGLMTLGSTMGDSNRGLSNMANLLGATALGFSVGGPWGAAIGGVTGMFMAYSQSGRGAIGTADEFTSAIRGQTDALNAATIAVARNKLEKSGAFDQGGKLGLSRNTVTAASLGDVTSRQTILDAKPVGSLNAPNVQAWVALTKTLDIVNGQFKQSQKDIANEANLLDILSGKARGTTQAVGDVSGALQGIPPQVVTELRALNFKPTQKQIAQIAQQYGLMPAQVSTLVEAIGANPTKKVVKEVLALLAQYDGTTAEAKVDVDISAAREKIGLILGMLAGIPGNLLGGGGGSDSGDDSNSSDTHRATGGPIVGPGSGTSDDVLLWGSNGEHMLTASDVDKMGGHAAVYRMRAAVQAGDVPAFAKGGKVNKGGGAPQTVLQGAQALEEAQLRADIASGIKELKAKGKDKALKGWPRRIAELQLAENQAALSRLLAGTKAGPAEGLSAVESAKQSLIDAANAPVSLFEKESDSPWMSGGGNFGARATAKATQIRTLAGKLYQLRQMGLNGALLAEIYGLGSRAGIAAADELLRSPSQIAQLNTAYSGIQSANQFVAGIGVAPQVAGDVRISIENISYDPVSLRSTLEVIARDATGKELARQSFDSKVGV